MQFKTFCALAVLLLVAARAAKATTARTRTHRFKASIKAVVGSKVKVIATDPRAGKQATTSSSKLRFMEGDNKQAVATVDKMNAPSGSSTSTTKSSTSTKAGASSGNKQAVATVDKTAPPSSSTASTTASNKSGASSAGKQGTTTTPSKLRFMGKSGVWAPGPGDSKTSLNWDSSSLLSSTSNSRPTARTTSTASAGPAGSAATAGAKRKMERAKAPNANSAGYRLKKAQRNLKAVLLEGKGKDLNIGYCVEDNIVRKTGKFIHDKTAPLRSFLDKLGTIGLFRGVFGNKTADSLQGKADAVSETQIPVVGGSVPGLNQAANLTTQMLGVKWDWKAALKKQFPFDAGIGKASTPDTFFNDNFCEKVMLSKVKYLYIHMHKNSSNLFDQTALFKSGTADATADATAEEDRSFSGIFGKGGCMMIRPCGQDESGTAKGLTGGFYTKTGIPITHGVKLHGVSLTSDGGLDLPTEKVRMWEWNPSANFSAGSRTLTPTGALNGGLLAQVSWDIPLDGMFNISWLNGDDTAAEDNNLQMVTDLKSSVAKLKPWSIKVSGHVWASGRIGKKGTISAAVRVPSTASGFLEVSHGGFEGDDSDAKVSVKIDAAGCRPRICKNLLAAKEKQLAEVRNKQWNRNWAAETCDAESGDLACRHFCAFTVAKINDESDWSVLTKRCAAYPARPDPEDFPKSPTVNDYVAWGWEPFSNDLDPDAKPSGKSGNTVEVTIKRIKNHIPAPGPEDVPADEGNRMVTVLMKPIKNDLKSDDDEEPDDASGDDDTIPPEDKPDETSAKIISSVLTSTRPSSVFRGQIFEAELFADATAVTLFGSGAGAASAKKKKAQALSVKGRGSVFISAKRETVHGPVEAQLAIKVELTVAANFTAFLSSIPFTLPTIAGESVGATAGNAVLKYAAPAVGLNNTKKGMTPDFFKDITVKGSVHAHIKHTSKVSSLAVKASIDKLVFNCANKTFAETRVGKLWEVIKMPLKAVGWLLQQGTKFIGWCMTQMGMERIMKHWEEMYNKSLVARALEKMSGFFQKLKELGVKAWDAICDPAGLLNGKKKTLGLVVAMSVDHATGIPGGDACVVFGDFGDSPKLCVSEIVNFLTGMGKKLLEKIGLGFVGEFLEMLSPGVKKLLAFFLKPTFSLIGLAAETGVQLIGDLAETVESMPVVDAILSGDAEKLQTVKVVKMMIYLAEGDFDGAKEKLEDFVKNSYTVGAIKGAAKVIDTLGFANPLTNAIKNGDPKELQSYRLGKMAYDLFRGDTDSATAMFKEFVSKSYTVAVFKGVKDWSEKIGKALLGEETFAEIKNTIKISVKQTAGAVVNVFTKAKGKLPKQGERTCPKKGTRTEKEQANECGPFPTMKQGLAPMPDFPDKDKLTWQCTCIGGECTRHVTRAFSDHRWCYAILPKPLHGDTGTIRNGGPCAKAAECRFRAADGSYSVGSINNLPKTIHRGATLFDNLGGAKEGAVVPFDCK